MRPGHPTTRSPRYAVGPGADLPIARIVALLLIVIPLGGVWLALHVSNVGPSPAAQEIASFDPSSLLAEGSQDFLPTPVAAIAPDAKAGPPPPAQGESATDSSGEQVRVANTGGLGAILRASAPSGKQVTALREGTLLQVIDHQTLPDGSEWLHVITPDGTEGWVFSRLVSPTN
jgi:hypothetical protein